MLLIIDNYDSFTYNLVQYFQILGQDVKVLKNDVQLSSISCLDPQYVVISPGPKDPLSAGVSLDVIDHFHDKRPILGVCLGHQCLAAYFGGNIIKAKDIMHGQTSLVMHDRQRLFTQIPNPFLATRYHSLLVESTSLPTCLQVDAWVENNIMAISHRQYPLFGLQFHPEAILTEHGFTLLANFLNYESL